MAALRRLDWPSRSVVAPVAGVRSTCARLLSRAGSIDPFFTFALFGEMTRRREIRMTLAIRQELPHGLNNSATTDTHPARPDRSTNTPLDEESYLSVGAFGRSGGQATITSTPAGEP